MRLMSRPCPPRPDSGTFLILAILALMVLLLVFLSLNLLIKKHRERTTVGTLQMKTYFAAKAGQDITEGFLTHGSFSPMWVPANPFAPFVIEIDSATLVQVSMQDQGF